MTNNVRFLGEPNFHLYYILMSMEYIKLSIFLGMPKKINIKKVKMDTFVS